MKSILATLHVITFVINDLPTNIISPIECNNFFCGNSVFFFQEMSIKTDGITLVGNVLYIFDLLHHILLHFLWIITFMGSFMFISPTML